MKLKAGRFVVLSKPLRREGVVEIEQRELASRLAKAMGMKWPTSDIERTKIYRLAEIATDYADEACERAGVRYS